MLKYETVIHIVTEGSDRFEAGELAGEMIDASKNNLGFHMWCEPTRLTSGYRGRVPMAAKDNTLTDIAI